MFTIYNSLCLKWKMKYKKINVCQSKKVRPMSVTICGTDIYKYTWHMCREVYKWTILMAALWWTRTCGLVPRIPYPSLHRHYTTRKTLDPIHRKHIEWQNHMHLEKLCSTLCSNISWYVAGVFYEYTCRCIKLDSVTRVTEPGRENATNLTFLHDNDNS